MYRTVLIFCCFCLPCSGSGQGIQFEQLSWSDLCAKAKTEGKFIFIDAVTSWCGPCKLMEQEVFPDSAVGAFFNTNFINARLDMERGEGIQIARQYKIWVYPSLLFLDSLGQIQHRSAGFHGQQELLSLAGIALDPFRNLSALERQFASGNRHREFLLRYLEAKTLAYDPEAGQIANDFLKTEEDLCMPENMDLLMRHVDDPYSRGFQFLLKNRALFEEKYGKRQVKVKIETVFENYLESHRELQLGDIQRLYGTVYPEGGELLASRYRLDYYRQKGETEQFARAAVDHFTRFPSEDPDELNELAFIFMEELNDPELLKVAIGWSQKAISLMETYYYQYTLARLWAKTGKKKAARKAAKRSIELAKVEGEDSFLAEDLLELLK